MAELIDTAMEPSLMNQQWRHDIATGADFLAMETHVPANDPHYDAKVFPCVHPYGTGSLHERMDGRRRLVCSMVTLLLLFLLLLLLLLLLLASTE